MIKQAIPIKQLNEFRIISDNCGFLEIGKTSCKISIIIVKLIPINKVLTKACFLNIGINKNPKGTNIKILIMKS